MHETFQIVRLYLEERGITLIHSAKGTKEAPEAAVAFKDGARVPIVANRIRLKGNVITEAGQQRPQFDLHDPTSLNRLAVHLWRKYALPRNVYGWDMWQNA